MVHANGQQPLARGLDLVCHPKSSGPQSIVEHWVSLFPGKWQHHRHWDLWNWAGSSAIDCLACSKCNRMLSHPSQTLHRMKLSKPKFGDDNMASSPNVWNASVPIWTLCQRKLPTPGVCFTVSNRHIFFWEIRQQLPFRFMNYLQVSLCCYKQQWHFQINTV